MHKYDGQNMRRANVDAALVVALSSPSVSSILVTGPSGCGKSHACEAAIAAHTVVRWDPVATNMKVPALVGMAPDSDADNTPKGVIVLYVDDVDVAVRGGPKGSSSSMLAAIRAVSCPVRRVGKLVVLVMTAADVSGDRVVNALAKAVDVHISLLPGRDEVVQVLRTLCPIDDAEALADTCHTDIRSAMLTGYACNTHDQPSCPDEYCGERSADLNAAWTRAHVHMEANATLLEAAGVGGDAACSDLLVWMAEEYRKNFSRCV